MISQVFSYPVKIRFNDIDAFGHVNNALYLTYFEEARMLFFDQILGTMHDWLGEGMVVAKAEVNYVLPTYLKDKLSVRIYCSAIGNKSFTLYYEITDENHILKCHGKTTLVMYNYHTNSSINVVGKLRDVLSGILKTT